jgi:hypothetical protein
VAIRVACYAGYRGEQEPLAFWLGERRLAVRAVVDRWFAPTQRWFKVEADDGDVYVLRHDEASGDWEIAAYRGVADRLEQPAFWTLPLMRPAGRWVSSLRAQPKAKS